MPLEIKGFLLITVICSILIWLTRLTLNYLATGWMIKHNDHVNRVLSINGLKLIRHSPANCAKCDTLFSICNDLAGNLKYLSSSDTKGIVNRLRTGKLSAEQVLDCYDALGKTI